MVSHQGSFLTFECVQTNLILFSSNFRPPLLDREGKTKGYYPHTDTVNYIVILFVLFVLDIPID